MILKSLRNISDEYWKIIPKINDYNGNFGINDISRILINQGIHYNGIGKYIYSFDDAEWYKEMTLDGISKILSILSLNKLYKIKKYYKNVKNRVIEIQEIIEKFYFFDNDNLDSINGVHIPILRKELSVNDYIQELELIVYCTKSNINSYNVTKLYLTKKIKLQIQKFKTKSIWKIWEKISIEL